MQPIIIHNIIQISKNGMFFEFNNNTITMPIAPEYNNISSTALKNLPINCIIYIDYLTNTIFTYVISPISKPGTNIFDQTNYRPISLLPSLSKIIEWVIMVQLPDYIQHYNILILSYSSSSGFLNFLGRNTMQKSQLQPLFLTKAFDKVWHEILIYKLIKLKFPIRLIRLIYS